MITHGFDNYGKHHDVSGNMSEWWDERSVGSFEKKTACFINQSGKYSVIAPNGTQVPVSEAYSLAENIADAGGVAASFQAWKNWEEKKGKAMSLPSLERFTHEQLFFIKWGQKFCKIYLAEVDVAKAISDTQS